MAVEAGLPQVYMELAEKCNPELAVNLAAMIYTSALNAVNEPSGEAPEKLRREAGIRAAELCRSHMLVIVPVFNKVFNKEAIIPGYVPFLALCRKGVVFANLGDAVLIPWHQLLCIADVVESSSDASVKTMLGFFKERGVSTPFAQVMALVYGSSLPLIRPDEYGEYRYSLADVDSSLIYAVNDFIIPQFIVLDMSTALKTRILNKLLDKMLVGGKLYEIEDILIPENMSGVDTIVYDMVSRSCQLRGEKIVCPGHVIRQLQGYGIDVVYRVYRGQLSEVFANVDEASVDMAIRKLIEQQGEGNMVQLPS